MAGINSGAMVPRVAAEASTTASTMSSRRFELDKESAPYLIKSFNAGKIVSSQIPVYYGSNTDLRSFSLRRE